MSTVLYLRQSLDRNNTELAVARQKRECEALCKRRSWSIDDTLVDNDESASKRGRPAYDELVERMAARTVTRVVILRIDRLLRLNDELEELIKLSEGTGIEVITVEGDINLATSQGRLMARILVSVARAEIEVKSERHKLANRQKAEAGKPHGSRRPYGYNEDQMTLREDEAAILREAANLVLNGASYKVVAWTLNERGVRTAEGKLWYPITIRNMLLKPRYGGIRTYNGEEVGRGLWEPIFDEATWEWLQATMRMRRENYKGRPKGRKYLLTGLVYCGGCGRALNGATKRDHPHRPIRRTYTCKIQGDAERNGGCGGVVRGADALEHFIREAVIYRLDTPDLGKLLNSSNGEDLAPLLEQRQALATKLDSLADDYADDTLTKAAYKRATARVEASLAALNAEIDEHSRAQVSVRLKAGESVREAWEAGDDRWRFRLMSSLIDKVTVKPGLTKPYYIADGVRYRFDPSLVEVDWRA